MPEFQQSLTRSVTRQVQKVIVKAWRKRPKRALAEYAEDAMETIELAAAVGPEDEEEPPCTSPAWGGAAMLAAASNLRAHPSSTSIGALSRASQRNTRARPRQRTARRSVLTRRGRRRRRPRVCRLAPSSIAASTSYFAEEFVGLRQLPSRSAATDSAAAASQPSVAWSVRSCADAAAVRRLGAADRLEVVERRERLAAERLVVARLAAERAAHHVPRLRVRRRRAEGVEAVAGDAVVEREALRVGERLAVERGASISRQPFGFSAHAELGERRVQQHVFEAERARVLLDDQPRLRASLDLAPDVGPRRRRAAATYAARVLRRVAAGAHRRRVRPARRAAARSFSFASSRWRSRPTNFQPLLCEPRCR